MFQLLFIFTIFTLLISTTLSKDVICESSKPLGDVADCSKPNIAKRVHQVQPTTQFTPTPSKSRYFVQIDAVPSDFISCSDWSIIFELRTCLSDLNLQPTPQDDLDCVLSTYQGINSKCGVSLDDQCSTSTSTEEQKKFCARGLFPPITCSEASHTCVVTKSFICAVEKDFSTEQPTECVTIDDSEAKIFSFTSKATFSPLKHFIQVNVEPQDPKPCKKRVDSHESIGKCLDALDAKDLQLDELDCALIGPTGLNPSCAIQKYQPCADMPNGCTDGLACSIADPKQDQICIDPYSFPCITGPNFVPLPAECSYFLQKDDVQMNRNKSLRFTPLKWITDVTSTEPVLSSKLCKNVRNRLPPQPDQASKVYLQDCLSHINALDLDPAHLSCYESEKTGISSLCAVKEGGACQPGQFCESGLICKNSVCSSVLCEVNMNLSNLSLPNQCLDAVEKKRAQIAPFQPVADFSSNRYFARLLHVHLDNNSENICKLAAADGSYGYDFDKLLANCLQHLKVVDLSVETEECVRNGPTGVNEFCPIKRFNSCSNSKGEDLFCEKGFECQKGEQGKKKCLPKLAGFSFVISGFQESSEDTFKATLTSIFTEYIQPPESTSFQSQDSEPEPEPEKNECKEPLLLSVDKFYPSRAYIRLSHEPSSKCRDQIRKTHSWFFYPSSPSDICLKQCGDLSCLCEKGSRCKAQSECAKGLVCDLDSTSPSCISSAMFAPMTLSILITVFFTLF